MADFTSPILEALKKAKQKLLGPPTVPAQNFLTGTPPVTAPPPSPKLVGAGETAMVPRPAGVPAAAGDFYQGASRGMKMVEGVAGPALPAAGAAPVAEMAAGAGRFGLKRALGIASVAPVLAIPTDLAARALGASVDSMLPTSRGGGPAGMQPGETPEAYRARSALLAPGEGPAPAPAQSGEEQQKNLKYYLAQRDSGNPAAQQRMRDSVKAEFAPDAQRLKDRGVLGMLDYQLGRTVGDIGKGVGMAVEPVARGLVGGKTVDEVKSAAGSIKDWLTKATAPKAETPAPAPAPVAPPTPAPAPAPAPEPTYRVRSLAEARKVAMDRSIGTDANVARAATDRRAATLTRGDMAPTDSGYRKQADTIRGTEARAADQKLAGEQADKNRNAALAAAALGGQVAAGTAAAKTKAEAQTEYGKALAELLKNPPPAPKDSSGKLLRQRSGALAGSVGWDLTNNPDHAASFNEQAAKLAQGFGLTGDEAEANISDEQAQKVAAAFAALPPEQKAEKMQDPRVQAALRAFARKQRALVPAAA